MSAGAAEERPSNDREIAHLAHPRRPPPGMFQFSLGTLLLVTTLIAACMGLVVAAPPLGALLTVVVILALVRTAVECRRTLLDGRTLRLVDKLKSFLVSVGFTILAMTAIYAALALSAVAAWTVSSSSNWIIGADDGFIVMVVMPLMTLVFVVIGVCTGGVTFVLLYWRTIQPRLSTTDARAIPTNTQHP
jgi:hypothetical protein